MCLASRLSEDVLLNNVQRLFVVRCFKKVVKFSQVEVFKINIKSDMLLEY